MIRRNWLDLSRKLVDRYDMSFTQDSLQQALGEYALAYWGEGVLSTSKYPNPFLITLSGIAFSGIVGPGIGFNDEGNLCEIPDTATSPQNKFIPLAADPSLDRWDLLVLRYKEKGSTAVPKPSDPLLTVFLNLSDDFELLVRAGTPSATPAYPAKTLNDIILAGLRVPAGAAFGTNIVLDLSIRETSRANFQVYPVLRQEIPAGIIDGSNQVFTLPSKPLNAESLLIIQDGLPLEQSLYSYDGDVTVTMNDAPATAQDLLAYYVEDSDSSENPLSGFQEVPAGAIDGSNQTFTLTGKPADQASSLLFINGKLLPPQNWSLIVNGLSASIKINAGYQPAIAQSIYIFYFVNPITVGAAPGGGGGGGGSAPNIIGSSIAPFAVSAGSGIPFSGSAYDNVIYVQGNGGAVAITATPSIQPGTLDGQKLEVRFTSDTNTVTVQSKENYPGSGVNGNGDFVGLKDRITSYRWDAAASEWFERFRR